MRLREFFWPVLEPVPSRRQFEIKKINRKRDVFTAHRDTRIDTMLRGAEKLSTIEESRVQTVERKCAIMAGFSGAGIMLGLGYVSMYDPIVFIFFLVANIYFLRAFLYAAEGLERKEYSSVGEKDIMDLAEADHPREELIALYIDHNVKNSHAINSKVDCMQMAILFFKRAAISAVALALAGAVL